MDVDSRPSGTRPSAVEEVDAAALWAEHGWAMTGLQFAVIALVFGLACATLAFVGAP